MHGTKAREVAFAGLLFALCIALSWLESLLTPLLGLMPGMKLGLSNVVVMYALLFLRPGTAFTLALLKALFAFFTRGPTAGLLSLCGGLLSLLVLWVLLHLPWPPTAYIYSVCGALAHNLGQLCGAAIILSTPMALAYAPVLLVVGIGVGALTSLVAKALYPALARVLPAARGSRGGKIFRI